MTQDEFFAFSKAACVHAVSTPGFIGFLRLTQYYREAHGEHKLREPELCQALTDEATARRLYHGVEAPTTDTYRFTAAEGEGKRRALHDFVLFGPDRGNAEPLVRVELKEGAPAMRKDDTGEVIDVPALSKDLRKLLQEPSADGRAVLHILQAADEQATLASLLKKYRVALDVALLGLRQEKPSRYGEVAGTWFSLLILAVRWRRRSGRTSPALWHVPLHFGRSGGAGDGGQPSLGPLDDPTLL